MFQNNTTDSVNFKNGPASKNAQIYYFSKCAEGFCGILICTIVMLSCPTTKKSCIIHILFGFNICLPLKAKYKVYFNLCVILLTFHYLGDDVASDMESCD